MNIQPYQVPGFEDVGTTGYRKPVDVKKIESILKPYLRGESLSVSSTGGIRSNDAPSQNELRDEYANVSNLPLSM